MYLTDEDYLNQGNISISLINPASYNITLKTIRRQHRMWRNVANDKQATLELWESLGCPDVLDKEKRELFYGEEYELPFEKQQILLPGEAALFSTHEIADLKNAQVGFVCMRSTGARAFVEQLHAGLLDPGFNGTIVLELKNEAYWPFYVYNGLSIAQVFTITGKDSISTYKGRYQKQNNAEPPR